MSERKIQHFRDEILANKGSKDSDLYYCNRLKSLKIHGRGRSILFIDLV